jgi:hypothetical protein
MGGKGAKLGPWGKFGCKRGFNVVPNARQSVQWILWDCGRHGGPVGNAGHGGKLVGPRANLGKVGILGFESGIMDPFLDRAPWGVGFPQAASTGDTCLLGFGDATTLGV